MKKSHTLISILLVFVLFGCPPPKAQKKMPRIFALSNTLDTGIEPSFLIADDFNRNDVLDLVVANSGGHSFSFYKGNGDGSFNDQLVYKTGRGPICLVAGDFNKDGYKDGQEIINLFNPLLPSKDLLTSGLVIRFNNSI